MHVRELIDSLPAGNPAPVYLFGPGKSNPRARDSSYEPFLAEHAAERLIEAYVDPANRDFAFSSFHADETAAAHVVAEAQTFPFLAERRVILVRNAEQYASEAAGEAMMAYLEDPADTTVLILLAGKVDKRTKFYKACVKAGEIIECPMLQEREALDWVRNEAKTRGKSIDGGAAKALFGRTGAGLSDINNALTLIIDFIGEDRERIREEDVTAACADVAETEIWALTDAIAASESGKAVVALRRLVDLGKHPDEIIGTINWLLKTAYQLATPEAGGNVHHFVAQKVQPLADKLGSRKLQDAFALCTDTQFMMRETGVDALLAIDLLVIKLSAPRGRSPRAG